MEDRAVVGELGVSDWRDIRCEVGVGGKMRTCAELILLLVVPVLGTWWGDIPLMGLPIL